MTIRGLDRVQDYAVKIVSTADNYSETLTVSKDDTIYVDTDATATVDQWPLSWSIGTSIANQPGGNREYAWKSDPISADWKITCDTLSKENDYGTVDVHSETESDVNYKFTSTGDSISGSMTGLSSILGHGDEDSQTEGRFGFTLDIDIKQPKSASVSTSDIRR